MKLSDILTYRELLDSQQLKADFLDASGQLDNIVYTVSNYPTQIGTFTQDIEAAAQAVNQSFANFENVMLDLYSTLDKIKKNMEPEMFVNSYNLWDQEMRFDTSDYILNRRLPIEPQDYEVMYGHILNYTDWRLPGMIIRPGLEKWVEQLVPLDPLYVVDTSEDLITPCITSFTEEYQRRLRSYVITDIEKTSILSALPDNQFGFVFAYNYFNYKPIEIIKRYLKEMFGKLRAGGVFMFTYNDCDLAHGAALAEKNFMCYTPGSMIIHEATMLGFEITYRHQGAGGMTWLELKRPGDIVSYRGGQSLAKIIVK